MNFQILLIFAIVGCANSHPRNGGMARLLGATQITREQLNGNYKGSASIAPGWTSEKDKGTGTIVATDKFLYSGNKLLTEIFVSTLTLHPVQSEDAESYNVIGEPEQVPGRGLFTYEFGPLSNDSKGVVASLPPAHSLPPQSGYECVVFTYGSTGLIDDPDNHILSYLPLIVVELDECIPKYGPQDDKLYFCATIKSPDGTNPQCSVGDVDMIAMCPGALPHEKLAEKTLAGEKWFWCLEKGFGLPCENHSTSVVEWIVAGLSSPALVDKTCNDDSELFILFAYTNII